MDRKQQILDFLDSLTLGEQKFTLEELERCLDPMRMPTCEKCGVPSHKGILYLHCNIPFETVFCDICCKRFDISPNTTVGEFLTSVEDSEEERREAHREDVEEAHLRSIYEEGSPEWEQANWE